jgi:Animal haem peroxidase
MIFDDSGVFQSILTHSSCFLSDLSEPDPLAGMMTIYIPMMNMDPFIAGNCTKIRMERSGFIEDPARGNLRMQKNDLTAFIGRSASLARSLVRLLGLSHLVDSFYCIFTDASNVYGSDNARAMELRTLSDGKLKTSQNGLLLPKNTAGLANAPDTTADFYLAGELDVMLFYREGFTSLWRLIVLSFLCKTKAILELMSSLVC